MTADAGRQLDVTANLELEVDGVPARVVSNGRRLEVHTDDLPGLVRGLAGAPGAIAGASLRAPVGARPGAPLRAVLGGLADAFDALNLQVTVHHRRKAVVRFGDGVDSRVSRVATGSRRVEVLSPVDAVQAAISDVVGRVDRRRVAITGSAAVATLVVALAARRRLSRP